MPREKSPRRQKRDDAVKKTLTKALDAFALKKGMGPDPETRNELVEELLRALEGHLTLPNGGQVVLLELDGERKYSNPRIEEAAGRDAEEILFPEDSGEAKASFVLWLPHPDEVPDI